MVQCIWDATASMVVPLAGPAAAPQQTTTTTTLMQQAGSAVTGGW